MKIPPSTGLICIVPLTRIRALDFPGVLGKLEHSKSELQSAVLPHSFLTQHLHKTGT